MIIKNKEAYNELLEVVEKYRKISKEKTTVIHFYHPEEKVNILEKKRINRCRNCEEGK